MSITERIAASFGRLWSLLSKKEKIMSDQTVIENSAATATPDASTLSPSESFAYEVAVPAASSAPVADAVSQDINASVKDFTQAFNFVESGVEKLGAAAKDELIALARKYL
mgnify:CR=1 FL=1